MFWRIGRLFRGFLGLFISGIEEANPEALMEAARQEFRQKITWQPAGDELAERLGYRALNVSAPAGMAGHDGTEVAAP